MIHVSDNPRHTLYMAGMPTDDDTVDRYGAAWLAAADQVGEQFGVEVDAILTSDAGVELSHRQLNDPAHLESETGPSLVQSIWQAMHDAVDLTSLGIDR